MLKRFLKGNILTIASFAVICLFLLMAVLSPLFVKHDPNTQNLLLRLKPPIWVKGADPAYLLGTDDLGRDILSRVIYGSRVSILVGVMSVLLSGIIGVTVGLLAGYYKALDQVAMRIADIQLAFPSILLALAIVAVIGGGLTNLILVIGITGWVRYARVVRSEVLSIRSIDFVMAAKTVGVGEFRIMFRHILPNIFAPVTTIATFQVASAIITESSLSFLGLGVPVTIPSWGNMLSEGQMYMGTAWWMAIFPGLCIMLVVLAVNILGNALRDFMDPKTQNN